MNIEKRWIRHSSITANIVRIAYPAILIAMVVGYIFYGSAIFLFVSIPLGFMFIGISYYLRISSSFYLSERTLKVKRLLRPVISYNLEDLCGFNNELESYLLTKLRSTFNPTVKTSTLVFINNSRVKISLFDDQLSELSKQINTLTRASRQQRLRQQINSAEGLSLRSGYREILYFLTASLFFGGGLIYWIWEKGFDSFGSNIAGLSILTFLALVSIYQTLLLAIQRAHLSYRGIVLWPLKGAKRDYRWNELRKVDRSAFGDLTGNKITLEFADGYRFALDTAQLEKASGIIAVLNEMINTAPEGTNLSSS